MQDILVATSNAGKLSELRAVAGDFGLNLISSLELAKIKSLGNVPEIVEDGDTYLCNARLKAQSYFIWSGGMPTLADDSGLEISCLGFKPGIFSARYGGQLTDRARNELILKEVADLEQRNREVDRSAFFVCDLVLFYAPSQELTAQARVSGQIVEPRGVGGFGFDPIVLLDDLGKTYAEVDFAVKSKYGFRAIAARELFAKYYSLRESLKKC